MSILIVKSLTKNILWKHKVINNKKDEEIDLLSNKLVADINKLLEESLDKSEVKALNTKIVPLRSQRDGLQKSSAAIADRPWSSK